MNPNNAVQELEGLLSWIPCFFFAICWDNCHPPNISRDFPSFCFFRANKIRRHVWNTVYRIVVEHVVLRVLRIPKNVVMFRWPTIFWFAAVVVRANEFVHKRCPSEDAIDENLRIMNFSVINMEEKRPIIGKHPPS